MMWPLSPPDIAQAYIAACRLEVRTLKPGNVHVHAEGHGMSVQDFDLSADVTAPHISAPGHSVGQRIRRAVEATAVAVATNTNLGIILLSAPLAAAAGPSGNGRRLQDRLHGVLQVLDHDDARDAFAAIAMARPAGLGEVRTGDVSAAPPAGMTLMDAMRLAADRDLVAAQYADGFSAVKETAQAYDAAVLQGLSETSALARTFLASLASRIDTHVARKHGPDIARDVMMRARERLARWPDLHDPYRPDVMADMLAFDTELKALNLNPGATADVMAAGVFMSKLRQAAQER